MSEFNQILFKKKTFADILEDIYNNSKKTEKQITELITSLGDKIDGPGAATILVPLIVQYLDVKVKNDEHLVKMAAIVQRSVSSKSSSSNEELMLTQEEEKKLLELAKELQESNTPIPMKTPTPLLNGNN